jgi:DNA modification methylase
MDSDLADILSIDDLELPDSIDGGEQGEGLTDPDEVPEPPEEPITQTGDLWLLGEHRLLCGDSTSAEDVGRLMDGEKADMLLSDPPYGVSYVGKTKESLTIKNDQLDESSLTEFIRNAFNNAEAICRSGAYWFATVPPGPLHLLFAEDWKRRGILRQIMVWAKDSLVLGHSEYHYQHEPILFGWIAGDRHKNSDRTRTTLWEYDRPKASREHPTMKPVPLWAQAVTDGSRRGEVVYDPFLGSGTTLIAAEQLGRKCYGMEIDPQYCDVIVKRWEDFTGQTATRENERT